MSLMCICAYNTKRTVAGIGFLIDTREAFQLSKADSEHWEKVGLVTFGIFLKKLENIRNHSVAK